MVTILGLGFTGTRVAGRLLARGIPVTAVVRDPGRFAVLAAQGLTLLEWGHDLSPIAPGSRLLHSIPTLPPVETASVHDAILRLAPRRVVYISSTGVYGTQTEVNEATPVAPADERGAARVTEEAWLRAGPWSTLILRAAAIYGPGRGVHTALREGRAPRGTSSGVVSRIHADDLAALCDAGLLSEAEGAWPVADDLPCSSAEIMDWCARQAGAGVAPSPSREFPVSGRRVDGTAVRRQLGVQLQYPTWHEGVPACIAAENSV